ncbi:MAG: phosphatase PAP2 family protein [Bacteroidia bacterium]
MRYLLLCIAFFQLQAASAQSGYEFLKRVHVHRNEKLDPLFKGFSASVLPITLLTPTSLYAYGWYKKDAKAKEAGIYTAATIVLSGSISLALKFGVARPRPYATHPDIVALDHAGPYSFPSAHSSNAFATATALSLMYPKWYVITPAFLWAGTASYSRMHLGMHYPGDVIAGALIGSGSAVACYYLNRWLRSRLGHSG